MAVLDSSAILAYLQGEPGAAVVAENVASALASAVNVSEVVAKLIDFGLDAAAIDEALAQAGVAIVPFDPDQARSAGLLRSVTRQRGLSLGDRACLALALARGLPALTADRAWAGIAVGVDVRVIR